MNRPIEAAYEKRRRYLKYHFAGVCAFVVTSLTEFGLRLSGVELARIRVFSLPLLILFVALQGLCVLRLALLHRSMKTDSLLAASLGDERVAHNQLAAWRSAFAGIALSVLGFAVVSTRYQVDLVYAALTSIVIGAGAYTGAFLVLER